MAGNSMLHYSDFAPAISVAPGWTIHMARSDYRVLKVSTEWREDTGDVVIIEAQEIGAAGRHKRFAVPQTRRVRVLR